MRVLSLISLLLILLSSCNDKLPCSTAHASINLVGFTDVEADTIVFRRHNAGNNAPIDSFLFGVNDPIRFRRSNDTLFASSYPGAATLMPGSNYYISIPGASKSYAITEITESQSYQRRHIFGGRADLCVNTLLSYKVNGTLVTNNNNANLLFIPR